MGVVPRPRFQSLVADVSTSASGESEYERRLGLVTTGPLEGCEERDDRASLSEGGQAETEGNDST